MISDACCQIPPVKSDYKPVGSMQNLGGDLAGYVVGDETSKKAVLVIYDIFGAHVNTQQFCDLLAQKGGYLVVMPDFFDDKPYARHMEGGIEGLRAWMAEVATFDKILPRVNITQHWLKAKGVTSAGLVGFCWGAKIAVQFTAVETFFGAISLIHPSDVNVADAEKANAPTPALPASTDADMTEYMAVLAKKPFGAKCKHYRFDDMHHGFAAARGDFTNELNRQRATEAIQMTASFFAENL